MCIFFLIACLTLEIFTCISCGFCIQWLDCTQNKFCMMISFIQLDTFVPVLATLTGFQMKIWKLLLLNEFLPSQVQSLCAVCVCVCVCMSVGVCVFNICTDTVMCVSMFVCVCIGGGGSDSGIFLACEGLGRMFDHSFPACAFFFFFFWGGGVEISLHKLTALFMPGSVHYLFVNFI